MKKKVISMMLAGAMVLSVTACGGKEDSAQTGTNTESAGAETDAGAAADAGATATAIATAAAATAAAATTTAATKSPPCQKVKTPGHRAGCFFCAVLVYFLHIWFSRPYREIMLSNADSFALKVVLFFRLFLSQNRIVVIHGQVTVRQYAFCRKIAVTTHDKSLRIGHRCYRILMAFLLFHEL